MLALIAALGGSITTIMIVVKQIEGMLTPPTDPTQLITYQQRIALLNLLLSIVLGVLGALYMVGNTPALFAGDPPLIAQNPYLFAVLGGLICVLPGGYGVSLGNALLVWLGLKAAPVLPAPQDVVVVSRARHITSLLWGD